MGLGANTSVYGLFSDERVVEQVGQALTAAGFRPEDIAILLARNSGNMDFGLERRTQAADYISRGAPVGALMGYGLYLATQYFPLSLDIQTHWFAQSPPLVLALAAVGLGATAGYAVGGVWGFGVPRYVANRYRGRKRHVGMLISVHCDDRSWCFKAKDILEHHQALDVSFRREAKPDFQASRTPYPTPAADRFTQGA